MDADVKTFLFKFENGCETHICFCYVFCPCAAAEGQVECVLLLVNREQSADIIDSPDTQGQ